jgi:large subunit ribosomal protein L5
LTIGFKESNIFPEVNPEEIDIVHGLEVTVVTTAKCCEEALELFKELGFPFKS